MGNVFVGNDKIVLSATIVKHSVGNDNAVGGKLLEKEM